MVEEECINTAIADVPEGVGMVFSRERNMPTYRYRCLKCKKEFDIFHKITRQMHKCPECGGKLERIITPNLAIIFKGSGFYETDYKRKSNGNGGNHGKSAPKIHTDKDTVKKVDEKVEKKVKKEKEASKKE